MPVMTDPELVKYITEAANSAGIRVDHMAIILSRFLSCQAANGHGHIESAILRGLSDEISEAF